MQRRTSLIVVLQILAIGVFTLEGFVPALIWAEIFAVGWQPMFERITTRFPKQRSVALLGLFVLAVLLVFVIPGVHGRGAVGQRRARCHSIVGTS